MRGSSNATPRIEIQARLQCPFTLYFTDLATVTPL